MTEHRRTSKRKLAFTVGMALAVPILLTHVAQPQPKRAKYALTEFNNYGCMAKGRVQDCSGSTVMRQILMDGKAAIPTLISQLTETTRTKYQIGDYWFDTRSRDVAYVVLTDLFTDSDLHTFGMPGVPDWSIIIKGCTTVAEGCLNKYFRKHGRLYVQKAWMRAWSRYKDKLNWDTKAQCFRISIN